MEVLVIGSSRCLDEPTRRKEFESAGEKLGKALADRGHTILIGTDDAEDIDPHVVRGAMQSTRKVQIQAHVIHGFRRMFRADEWKKAEVEHHPHQFPDWDVTAMEVIRRVDAVVVIGGKAATVHAGVAAWMMGKAVMPIGSFGGGARVVWDYGSASRASFYHGALGDLQIDRLASSWDGDALGLVVALERLATATALPAGSQRRLLWTMVGALIGWVGFLIPWADPAGLWQLFAAACCAGLLGSGIRILRSVRDGVAVRSQSILVDFGLGFTSGLVTAMLYLLAQVGINGKVDLKLPTADYARVALITSIAALFAGMYLDAALARFDKVKDSVLEGTHGKPAAPAKPVAPAPPPPAQPPKPAPPGDGTT